MDEPYTLYLSGSTDTRATASYEPPPDLGIPIIPYAHSELITNNQVSILRQHFLGRSLFIDLCSYRVSRKTATVYASIKNPVLLFCYLLKGQIINLEDQKKGITVLLGNQYTALYLLSGKHRLKLGKGNYLVLNFSLAEDFLLSVTTSCPLLHHLARSLNPNDETRQVISHCRIDFNVKRVISRLRKAYGPRNLIEPLLIGQIAELLALYEARLQSGDFLHYKTAREEVYEIKELIENNYTRAACQVNQIVRDFNSTRKALSREYKKEFGISMKEHIIQLRMTLALKLLEKNHLIKEVTAAVGYENPFSFSRMFKKYYGYPPEEKKATKRTRCFI